MKPDAGDRDDVALLRAVARGDEEALAALYDRHAGWLTVRLTRRCSQPDVVDHAVQDTFLALWREAGTIALAWYAPITSRFLAEPPATPHSVTIAWYAVASAALALACVAMRDQWHRYSRLLRHRWPGHAWRGEGSR